MPLYRAKGVLTGTIEQENVAQAQAYLTRDDMTQFLDNGLALVVEHIEWKLEGDGHNWTVTAYATRELTTTELAAMSAWVSGQNSDGLGESFEQQDFAWEENDGEDEETCSNCDGTGQADNWGRSDDDPEQIECGECDGQGYFERDDDGRMISFDWETNDIVWERVK